MSSKTIFTTLLKYLAVVTVYVVVELVSGMLFPIGLAWTPPPEQLPWVFGGILLVALVNSAIICLLIARSRWSGWKLYGTIAFAWYGTMTFMAQIEAYWFAPSLGLSRDVPVTLAIRALPLVLIVTLVALFMWGRVKPALTTAETDNRFMESPVEWFVKLAVIAMAYLVLYFGFGFIVAWQNPALRDMYANGTDPIVFNYAYLLPLQIIRSGLWVLFALPVIRMTRGSIWQVALVVGLLFALPMNIGHFIPNPIMPDPSVRLSHFIETSTSNLIFGLFVTWLLSWHPGFLTMRNIRPAKL